MSGVPENVRGTNGCPRYERMSGVREDVRGTRVCPGYEGIGTGVRIYLEYLPDHTPPDLMYQRRD